MTAGKGQRLTKADEVAIAKLLAEGDDYQVMRLAVAIRCYELTAGNAKARLAKRKVWTPTEFCWFGGYRAAMQAIRDVIRELIDAGLTGHDIILAVADVARSAEDLAFAESTVAAWPGGAS